MQRKHEVVIDVIHPDVEIDYKNENENGNNLLMCVISTIALLVLGVTQLYATIK